LEQEKVYYLVYPTLERMNPNKNIDKIIEKGDEVELEEIILESDELDWVERIGFDINNKYLYLLGKTEL
jgi:hypothetical protein